MQAQTSQILYIASDMKYCSCFIILLDALVLCYAGELTNDNRCGLTIIMVTQTGDAKATLDLPTTIFLGEPSFGRCSVNNLENSPKQIKVSFISQKCTANNTGKIYSIEQLSYQQNFTLTCRNGSTPSVDVFCLVVPSSISPFILPAKGTVQGKLKLHQN